MFSREMKSDEKLNLTINFVMIIFVITSITLTIIESVESLMTPDLKSLFLSIHLAILGAFMAELLYRLWYAPVMYPNLSSNMARIRFLFHPLTIVDMIVIAPLFAMIWTQDLHNADTVILRILRFTTVFNMFHFYRSSKVIRLLRDMSREIWFEMMVIFILAIQCIIISGVLFYALENTKNPVVTNIFDGIWWSVITMTTIGYGDIVPLTLGGRILGIILALVGVGLVALPTGILTSGFIRALRNEKKMTEIIENIEEEAREQDNIIERVQKIEENSIKSRRRPSVASSRIFGKKKRKK